MKLDLNLIAAKILLVGLFFVTIAITPWNNLEPTVLPKLFVFVLTTCFAGFLVLIGLKKSHGSTTLLVLTVSSYLMILLSIVNNPKFISERIFGITGRNVGAIILFSVFLFLFIAQSCIGSLSSKQIVYTFKLGSSVVVTYFFLQTLDWDPAKWNNEFSGIPSSTLGNPNFVSAFVAMSVSGSLPLIVDLGTRWIEKSVLVVVGLAEVVVLIMTDNLQGLSIVLSCMLILLLVKIRTLVFLLFVRKTFILIVILFSFFFLYRSFFSTFFLNRIMSDSSIRARIDYWQAGLSMIKANPLFGVGLDYFGDSYLIFRSDEAANRAAGVFSDSAHNYFIDIGAFGGVILLACYTIPSIMVIIKLNSILYKQIRTSDRGGVPISLSSSFLGCILIWLGFLMQSMINPINLALLYSGCFLTSYLATSLRVFVPKRRLVEDSDRKPKLSNSLTMRPRVWLIKLLLIPITSVFPILSIQPMLVDAKFRNAMEQGNGDEIYRISLSEPRSYQKMEYAARIFIDNDRVDLAIQILRTMVRDSPDNVRGWKLIATYSPYESERLSAMELIRLKDPKNPDLK